MLINCEIYDIMMKNTLQYWRIFMANTSTDKSISAFRTSMSGFKKEDVNNYILKMNKDFREKEAEYKNEIEQLTLDAEKTADILIQSERLNAEINELQSVIRKISAEKISLELKLSESDNSGEIIERLNQTISDEIEKSSACEKIIAEQRDIIDLLKDEIEALKREKNNAPAKEDDEIVEKSQRYDEVRKQIGDILITANKTSDEIIEKASLKADDIIDLAKADAGQKRKYISDTTYEILKNFKNDFNYTSQQCLNDITFSLNEVRNETAALLSEMEKRNKDLSDKIAYYGSLLNDSIKENLDYLDKKISSGNTKS